MESIYYSLEDNRRVEIQFTEILGRTKIVQTCKAETENAEEMQQQSWLAVMSIYETYVKKSE